MAGDQRLAGKVGAVNACHSSGKTWRRGVWDEFTDNAVVSRYLQVGR